MNENVEIKSEKGRQINIKSLFVRGMLRWKKILLITIACCLLGMIYSYKEEKEELANQSEQYNEASATNQNQNTDFYSNIIGTFDEAINERYQYLNDTVVKNLNPYSQPQVISLVYIKGSNQTITPVETEEETSFVQSGSSVTFAQALNNFIWYGLTWDDLKDEFLIDDDVLLNELVQVEVNNDLVTIKTSYTDLDGANKIMDYVLEQVKIKFDDMVALTNEDLEMYILARGEGNRIFSNNFEWLSKRANEINALITAKNTFINNYSAQSSKVDINVKKSISKKAILKSGIQYGAIGFLAGILSVLMYLILSGTVLSSKELNGTYETKEICVLEKPQKGIQKAILSIEDENRSNLSNQVRYELSASLIEQLIKKGSLIAVIGDIGPDKINTIVENLKKSIHENSIIGLPNIIGDVENRLKLEKADYVLLATCIEKSKYSKIDDIVRLTTYYKKPLIGTIVSE